MNKKLLSWITVVGACCCCFAGCGETEEVPEEEAQATYTPLPTPPEDVEIVDIGTLTITPPEDEETVPPYDGDISSTIFFGAVNWSYVPFPVSTAEDAREPIAYGEWEGADLAHVYYSVLKHYVVNDFSGWYGEDGYTFKDDTFAYAVEEGSQVTYHNCDTNTCFQEFCDDYTVDYENCVVGFTTRKDCIADPDTEGTDYIEHTDGTPCTAYMYVVVDPHQGYRVKEAYVSVDDYDWIEQMIEEHPQSLE